MLGVERLFLCVSWQMPSTNNNYTEKMQLEYSIVAEFVHLFIVEVLLTYYFSKMVQALVLLVFPCLHLLIPGKPGFQRYLKH